MEFLAVHACAHSRICSCPDPTGQRFKDRFQSPLTRFCARAGDSQPESVRTR